jgi:Set1/Ash2 histone methyltransferase complex subunit ASH2
MGPESRPEGYATRPSAPPAKRAKTTGRGRGKAAKMKAFKPEVVALDRANQLTQFLDGMTIGGTNMLGGGYRMARATHGSDAGCWYYEVQIDRNTQGREDAAYRIGFAHKKATLQGPCGMDRYSFGYRSLEGSLVHASRRIDEMNEPYGPGDIVGCLINFQSDELEDIESDHPDDFSEFPKNPKRPQGNYVRYFKNGRDQGVAFENIPAGAYRAAASVYRTGGFRINLGPDFAAWPLRPARMARLSPTERKAKGVCELVHPEDTQHAVHVVAQAQEQERLRLEAARLVEDEKKAMEAKAQAETMKNVRRNARRT